MHMYRQMHKYNCAYNYIYIYIYMYRSKHFLSLISVH